MADQQTSRSGEPEEGSTEPPLYGTKIKDDTDDDTEEDTDEDTEKKTLSTSEGLWAEPLRTEPEGGASNSPDETVFYPEVFREEYQPAYRFRCPSAGAFRCSSTGLMFVVTKGVDLKYKLALWDEDLLRSSGRSPAGPLYDIKCPERDVCELHLPHCEPENVDLSQTGLSVAYISDSGLSLMEPQRTTESHVVVSVSGHSLLGLLKKLRSSLWTVSGQVMLFRTPSERSTRKITINMLLLPRNICLNRVHQVTENLWNTTEYISVPSKCDMVIGREYSVVCSSAEVVQPEMAQFQIEHEPNFHPTFQLWLPPGSSTISITVKEMNTRQKREVWRCQVNLNEAHFVDKHRKTLIEQVSNVASILDHLLQEGVLDEEQYNETRAFSTKQDQMRFLFTVPLKAGGARSKDVLLSALEEEEPTLIKELRERDT